ncbi:hypothetical protein L1887_12594 [Cichorium endivia]|nr:hypothetical protein L1887_12594 [Cichorium endivia]
MFVVCSITTSSDSNGDGGTSVEIGGKEKKLSEQSSWEAKDSEGNDYLYRLGKEYENMNIAVGARAGVIHDLFIGGFLCKDRTSLVYFMRFCSVSQLNLKLRF